MMPVTYGHDYWIQRDGADTRKIRDRLLTVEGGGATKQLGGGGESSFTSTKKEGRAKSVLAIWNGGRGRFEVVLTQELDVSAILKGGGGANKIHPFKRGARIVLPCVFFLGGGGEGGGHNKFQARDVPILQHPLLVINDRSLRD